MTARTPLMAGNWKMNLDHLEAAHLVQKTAWALDDASFDHDKVDVVVLPPFTDLRTVQTLVDGDSLKLKYGAQDISAHESGAYTGEVSGAMLSKLGCSFVTIGHSERRQYHAETDELVNTKTKVALSKDITPIVCVGEGKDQRDSGEYVDVVLAQVEGALSGLTAEQVASVVVAYEPVWAIGTGAVATPDDAQEVCAAIRVKVAKLHDQQTADTMRILYGGSVKPTSAAGLMACADIDGALIGGASLKAEDFVSICRFDTDASA